MAGRQRNPGDGWHAAAWRIEWLLWLWRAKVWKRITPARVIEWLISAMMRHGTAKWMEYVNTRDEPGR